VEASAVEREAAVVAPERPPGPEPEPEDGDGAARPYVVQEREQRRILSWSPDPFDAEPEPALEAAPPDAAVEPPAPQPAAAAPPARAPRERPRGRGRPRSAKTRRQVHFHIDAGDEQLLLAAARMFGSQQKGLIAALQALQERELLEEERDRLLAECERQRSRLAELEGLFGRPT
jgi:hypothetical protein